MSPLACSFCPVSRYGDETVLYSGRGYALTRSPSSTYIVKRPQVLQGTGKLTRAVPTRSESISFDRFHVPPSTATGPEAAGVPFSARNADLRRDS